MSLRVSTWCDREVLRRHHGRRRAAEARRRGEAEFTDTGAGREPVAQGIEARQLRLHLAELDGHGIEVLLDEGATAVGFGLLRREHQALQRRRTDLGGVAQREPVEARRRSAEKRETK
jgi:hypothetical protein